MTSIKDDNNFRSLDDARWEELCYLLFKEEYVGLHRVDGSGGDEGIDAYVDTFDNPRIVFQFKFFPNGFGPQQVRQIKGSLEKALEKRSGFRWILACSAEPTPAARRALDKLIENHQDVEIEILGEGDMKSKLLKHPAVCRCFYDDGMETLKGVLSLGDMDPLKRAREGVRIYNDSIIDERFQATVTTDGKSTVIAYSPHPDFADVPPTFSIQLKSKSAAEAYKQLITQGIPLELSGEDVTVGDSELPGVPMNDWSLQSLKIIPHCEPRPTQLRFYSSKEANNHQTLFIELRTEREGTECIVRSNSQQKNAPVAFQLATPASFSLEDATVKPTINIAPQFIGNQVATALKGARFLGQLSKTGKIGISYVDDDFAEASFLTLEDLTGCEIWAHQLAYIEAIGRVCRFFEINPVIDDSLYDEDFLDTIRYLDEKIANQGKNIEGTVTFTFEAINQEFVCSIQGKEKASVVANLDWRGRVFGNAIAARIRVTACGSHSINPTDNGKWLFSLCGSYCCFIEKVLP